MEPATRATIDLATRVWLGIAPMREVQDWVDAQLAAVAHADERLLRLAENRARDRHEVAADLLDAAGDPDGAATTHAMIVALGEAFERDAITIRAAAAFLLGVLNERVEAIGALSDAYGLEDAIDLAEGGIYGGYRDDALAHLRAIVETSRRALDLTPR